MLLQPHMYSVFREQDCFRDFYLSVMKIIPFQILDIQNILLVFYLYIAFDLTIIPPLKGYYRTVVGFPIRKICKVFYFPYLQFKFLLYKKELIHNQLFFPSIIYDASYVLLFCNSLNKAAIIKKITKTNGNAAMIAAVCKVL